MTFDAVSTPFEVRVTHVESITVLSVHGDVDLASAPALTESIDAVLAESPPDGLIVDLTDVPFLASMGMTVLIEANRRVGDDTAFAVVADGPSTERPLKMMGLENSFTIYTDLDAAITALGR